jgi:hypothetical protein
VGVGWGWACSVTLVEDTWVAHVEIWHGNDNNRLSVVGAAKKGNDADGPKKALTDAITKGLSYLGCNADVFLGNFDDNKYVQQMRQSFGERKTVKGLLAWVGRMRAGCESSLDDKGFLGAVAAQEMPGRAAGSPITTEQLQQIRDALEAGAYDWLTGDRIPPETAA